MKIEEILELQLERLKAIIIEGRQKSLTNQEEIYLKDFYTKNISNSEFPLDLKNYFDSEDNKELQNYCLAQWIDELENDNTPQTATAKGLIDTIIFYWKESVAENYQSNLPKTNPDLSASFEKYINNMVKELNLDEGKLTPQDMRKIVSIMHNNILGDMVKFVESKDEKHIKDLKSLICKAEIMQIPVIMDISAELCERESLLNTIESEINLRFSNESERLPLSRAAKLAQIEVIIKSKELFANLNNKVSQQPIQENTKSLISLIQNLKVIYQDLKKDIPALRRQYNDSIAKHLAIYKDLHNSTKTQMLETIEKVTKINVPQECNLVTSEINKFAEFLRNDLDYLIRTNTELVGLLSQESSSVKITQQEEDDALQQVKKISRQIAKTNGNIYQSFLPNAQNKNITVTLKRVEKPNSIFSITIKIYEATIQDNTDLNNQINSMFAEHAKCRDPLQTKQDELLTQLRQENLLHDLQEKKILTKTREVISTTRNNGIFKALLAIALVITAGALISSAVTLGLMLSATAIIPLAVPIALAVVAAIGAVTAIGSGVGLYKSDKQVKIQQAELEMPEQSVLNGPTVAALDHKQNTVMAK